MSWPAVNALSFEDDGGELNHQLTSHGQFECTERVGWLARVTDTERPPSRWTLGSSGCRASSKGKPPCGGLGWRRGSGLAGGS